MGMPRERAEEHLDYFLVRRDSQTRVKDVKVVRGAEIGSDHYLVLLKMSKNSMVERSRAVSKNVRIRTDRLKDKRVRLEFKLRLQQKMNTTGHREESMEEVWAKFKEGVLSAAVEVCGVRQQKGQRKRMRWWNDEVKEAVKKKKVAYLKWLQRNTQEAKDEYHRAKKEAKRVVRIAQNEEWVELGRSLQNDFQNNQRRFWSRVKAPKRGSEEVQKICDDNGQVIEDEEGVMERWKDYFAGLLQGAQKEEEGNKDVRTGPTHEEDSIDIEEVVEAIAKLKSGKAPGICGIDAEMLKAGGMVVAEWLHRVIKLAWTKGEVVKDWRKADIVPLHKKGSKTLCSNYRGISLLSIPSKVYARILDSRVRRKTEGEVMEVQGGFRQGRGCGDQIFTIRQLSEKVLEKNKQMVIACIDLERAYDKVSRDRLWQVLESYGIQEGLLRAIQSMYLGSQAWVRTSGKVSGWFPITQGVRQGCVMSPWLFNVFMDGIMRETKEKLQGGVQLTTTNLQLILFADDIVMVTGKEEDMQTNLGEMKKVMDKWGMKMHLGKTKVMMVSRTEEDCNLNIEGEDIETVKKLKYLGVMVSSDGLCDEEIEQHVGAAAKVVGAMRKEVLERRELLKKTKLRVFNAMVVPTLIYGCETWTMQRRHESNLQASEMMFLRRVEGVSRLDRVRN